MSLSNVSRARRSATKSPLIPIEGHRPRACAGTLHESPLRVLLCLDALGVGGKERQAVELIQGLAARPEICCRVICLEPQDFYLEQLATVPVPIQFVTRRVRWDAGLFVRLRKAIRQHRPQVIHTNGLLSSFYMLPLAKLLRIPLINGSIRNAFPCGDLRWRIERGLAALSDYRVANSFAGLRSRGFADGGARNAVIYNGFDFARLNRVPRGIPATRSNGVKIVGMVAEFNPFKDYPTFIQTARQLSGKRRDVRFVTVGAGQTLAACQRMAAGIPAIQFLGERKDVEAIVETFDIGVLSTFTEGISNSIMEYMALGKPVVATDGGGTRELVVDGETGLLVPPRDPDALAAKIEYLLDHPHIARRMGAAGAARLRRQSSMETMVERTVQLYTLAAVRQS